jgi:hypothetical protein
LEELKKKKIEKPLVKKQPAIESAPKEDAEMSEEEKAKQKSKPISSTPIPGTPWCVVWTRDKRVFFYNPSERVSLWERPAALIGRNDVDKLLKEPNVASNDQLNHRDYIYDSIRRGHLKFKNSICFCAEHQGFIIDNYDAWGFNVPTIVCSRCYTIRSKFFLDEISIMKFYKEDFYAPHMFTTKNSDKIGMDYNSYYDEELKKGKEIFNFIFKNLKKNEIKSVLEIGCGAGGILEEFYNNDIVEKFKNIAIKIIDKLKCT